MRRGNVLAPEGAKKNNCPGTTLIVKTATLSGVLCRTMTTCGKLKQHASLSGARKPFRFESR